MRPALDDGDLGTEVPEGLRHFQADVAAADDDEVRGQHVERERLDVRERYGFAQARDRWNGGACAKVEEDALAREPARAALAGNFDDARLDEPPPPEHEVEAALGKGFRIGRDHAGDDLGCAAGDSTHVDGGGFRRNPERAGPTNERRYGCATHQGLGWDAGNVNARAANHPGFHDGHAPAAPGLVHGQGLASFAAAQDQDLVALNRTMDASLRGLLTPVDDQI